ncbi:MAG: tRNA uridine-5-carboxymethylaminomethyl(34) synthesis enzyme MnmG [Lentisphaeria bacterium]|nr:tRNA uridine-5-carboxymethylaminomethyl(34) synthesis enzyme MnmG [Lentisphaeria bacterium]
MKVYDVIVVGAGHAGCEAALAAARLGASTAVLTLKPDHIAQMSCNPAVGGISKGQVVREIDALGGFQGIAAEAAAIQFRMLNRTKGPAVWSPRAQCDKSVYRRAMKLLLERNENIDILQCEVTGFILDGGRIAGVVNQFGEKIPGRSVVLTTGTFLAGKLHYGLCSFPGGRAGDFPASHLSSALRDQLGLVTGRLKTGTPPRILKKSIDFSNLQRQDSETAQEEFCFWSEDCRPALPRAARRNLACHMLYTTEETARIVRDNLDKSPMYSGVIRGIGTRYCPSFEDKVVRFPQHPRHLLFLEPEGAETDEYYLNGFSSSLPVEVQRKMVHSLPGLEHAVISRYAYAIEYDYLPPAQMERTLRNRRYENLFTAGQINGTSGYEEAAAQGLIAGFNAARSVLGREPVAPGRDSSYIGVMLDDLTTKEIVEPYRLFTSRAEYRLSLRQDNADLRLCPFAWRNGLLPEEKYREFEAYRKSFSELLTAVRERRYRGRPLLSLMKEMEGDVHAELPFPAELLPEWDPESRASRQVLVESIYDGYLQREEKEIQRRETLENTAIPADVDYEHLQGLCSEARQKLIKLRPATLGQAARIDGVTPVDTALLQVAIKRGEKA